MNRVIWDNWRKSRRARSRLPGHARRRFSTHNCAIIHMESSCKMQRYITKKVHRILSFHLHSQQYRSRLSIIKKIQIETSWVVAPSPLNSNLRGQMRPMDNQNNWGRCLRIKGTSWPHIVKKTRPMTLYRSWNPNYEHLCMRSKSPNRWSWTGSSLTTLRNSLRESQELTRSSSKRRTGRRGRLCT